MGYQFIHLDSYARTGSKQLRKDKKTGRVTETRKWSARDIAAEAERVPDACRHVEHPLPPVVLHGCMPSEAVLLAEQWAAESKDALGRSLRKDGLCLAAGVVSLPAAQKDDWPLFREATVAWLREQYGERLRSVIEHTDEEHPHLHFYAVPLAGERFEAVHIGRQAAARSAQDGGQKGAQNAALKTAMRAWQDDFGGAVGSRFGLARLGPKRRRLPRAAWQAEQAQARALARIEPPAELRITAEDVKKLVTKKSFLGSEYESGEELAARLTQLVRDRAASIVVTANQAVATSSQASRLLEENKRVMSKSETARADRAEERAQRMEKNWDQALSKNSKLETQFEQLKRQIEFLQKKMDRVIEDYEQQIAELRSDTGNDYDGPA